MFWARRWGSREGWHGFLPCRWGYWPGLLHLPETPCPSRHGSRLLGVEHLAVCLLHLSAFAVSPRGAELSSPTHSSCPGALPSNIPIECWEATGPLEAPGHLPPRERPSPPWCRAEEGTSSARCHHALEPGRRCERGPEAPSQRDATSGLAAGSSEAAARGPKLPTRC